MSIILSQIDTTISLNDLVSRYGIAGASVLIMLLTTVWLVRQQRLSMDAQLRSYEGQIDNLAQNQTLLQDDWRAKSEAIRVQEVTINDLQTQVLKSKLDYVTQAGELSAAMNDIEDLKARDAKKDGEIIELNKQIKALQGYMVDAENNLIEAEKTRDEAQKQAHELIAFVDKLKREQTEDRARLTTQEAEIIRLNEVVKQQEQTIKTQSGEILALGERVRHLENEKAALVADIDALAEGMNAQPLPLTKPIKDEGDKGMS